MDKIEVKVSVNNKVFMNYLEGREGEGEEVVTKVRCLNMKTPCWNETTVLGDSGKEEEKTTGSPQLGLVRHPEVRRTRWKF